MSVQPPQSVLVLDGPAPVRGRETSRDHLPETGRPMNVLRVFDATSIDGHESRLAGDTDHLGSMGYVAVHHRPSESPRDEDAIRQVSTPADPTGIGLAVVEWLHAHSRDGDLAVCIDGVSTMVEQTSLERVFRLLHALEVTCRDHGARFHVHVAETAHDDRTIGTLRHVFDEQRKTRVDCPAVDVEAGGVSAELDAVDGAGD